MASKGWTCKDGSGFCSESEGIPVTDAYEIFNAIGFGKEDYLPGEDSTAAKLIEKTEECSSVKLTAKKREAWGAFLTQTAGGIGQKTNTGNIMSQIGSLTQSGGGALGAVGSLGGVASQMMQ